MAKLTITVEADKASGISSLLELALAELKHNSHGLVDYDKSMAGHQAGTMGSYDVQYEAPERDRSWFGSRDSFASSTADEPRTPKTVPGYEHPEGWFEDSILLIDDPAQPTLKEGQLLSYMREVRGHHIYVLLTDQGVTTVPREHLQLKHPRENVQNA
ncbi:hypothetical protein [Pseudomonas caspiana]|nr:hypothetical protein [Pseudomonas caspiana]